MTSFRDKIISIAPMMDCTDRHYRYLMRLIGKHWFLYSEMVSTGAILKGDAHYHLQYNEEEHPVALQLGGSNPEDLALAARKGEEYGYDEINLNVGCPSDRVQNAMFGACLMKHPQLVGECVQAMQSSVKVPVTVKTRIGVDDLDSYEYFRDFVGYVAEKGCRYFIIHARKAWLQGLSPKENREIPPLHYDRVVQLKKEFPQLRIVINGGIQTLEQVRTLCADLDGVMLGRKAFDDPWFFHQLGGELLGADAVNSRQEVCLKYLAYAEHQLTLGIPFTLIIRPILGLFNGEPGARRYRRILSENSAPGARVPQTLRKAFAEMNIVI